MKRNIKILLSILLPAIIFGAFGISQVYAAITVTVTATPSSINNGQSTVIRWSSSGTIGAPTFCTSPNFNTGNATSNAVGVTLSPSTTTTYTVNCYRPTGTITATSCTIPSGGSTCNSSLTWSTADLSSSPTEVRKNPGNTLVSSQTSGTNIASAIGFGATTFSLNHNSVLLASATANGTCAAGTTWNNTICAVPTTPDLTASGVTPSTVIINTSVTFSATVSNIGSASTGASFSNFFQRATSASGGGTITDLTPSTMATLTAGASNTATSPSQTFTTVGTYSVRVCADKSNSASLGTITESNEGNNCGPWTNITATAPALPAVPVVTISASPITGTVNIVNPTITWSATNNPTSCTASGDWSGSKAVGGGSQSQGVLTSVRNYTYTLVCANAGGTSTPQSATVVVNAAPLAPTVTLTSNPSPAIIPLGQSVTLTWTSTNATSCTGSGFNAGGATSNLTGVIVTPPVLPTTYSITCFNSVGTPSAPSSVTVTDSKKRPIYQEP